MSFPVSYSASVSVSCSEDRELRGDDVITCNQETDFKFHNKPKCNDAGMYKGRSPSTFNKIIVEGMKNDLKRYK